MTQEQLEQLVRILNALYTISTRGKETVLMGQCLELMEKTLLDIQKTMETQNASQDVMS